MAALQSLRSAQKQNSARAAFCEDALGQTIDEVRHLKSPRRAQQTQGAGPEAMPQDGMLGHYAAAPGAVIGETPKLKDSFPSWKEELEL